MKTYSKIEELVGRTPILKLNRLQKLLELKGELYAKLESFNPAGSAKDRIALSILDAYEKSGALKKGGTVIEPTSGNTGIALSAFATARGYKAVIVMPSSASEERKKLIRAYGAELVLTPAEEGMQGAVAKAEEIRRKTKNSIIAGQFDNPANPKAHEETTAKEILADMDSNIDYFVAGVGTGGTLTGVSRGLKREIPNVKAVAVEPTNSPLLSQGKAGTHGLQGIGANFIPEVLDRTLVDFVETASEEESFTAVRLLARAEGFLAGISSGATLAVGIRLASLSENEGKKILLLFPDGGERYLSVNGLFR